MSPWHDIPLRNADGTLNFVCGAQLAHLSGKPAALSALSYTLRAPSACVSVQSWAVRVCLLAAHRLCHVPCAMCHVPCATCEGGSRRVRVRCVWRPTQRSAVEREAGFLRGRALT